MDILADKLLIYGIGDSGYGSINIKDNFRQFEQPCDEKDEKFIAKTNLISNFRKDGFVFKSGGYTSA